MTAPDAWSLDDFPAVEQALVAEDLEAHLTGAEVGEEELLDLERVQVAVVVEGLQDEEVALVDRAVQTTQLSLCWMRFCVRRKVSQDDRMSWNERPSWPLRRCTLKSRSRRLALRFLKRRPRRRPRGEVRGRLGAPILATLERLRI